MLSKVGVTPTISGKATLIADSFLQQEGRKCGRTLLEVNLVAPYKSSRWTNCPVVQKLGKYPVGEEHIEGLAFLGVHLPAILAVEEIFHARMRPGGEIDPVWRAR